MNLKQAAAARKDSTGLIMIKIQLPKKAGKAPRDAVRIIEVRLALI